MTIKGMIFDLDGTLLDTIEDLRDSVNLAMDRFGYARYTSADIKQKIGDGMKVLIQRCLDEEASEALVDEVIQVFLQDYNRRQFDKTAPYDGILDMLFTLNAKGIQVGVISNKQNANTQSIVAHYFKEIAFTFVSGEIQGIDRKPDPTLTLRCVDAMKLKSDEILYVGDTKVDMLTGHNAGLKTVGVTWGFRDRQELIDHSADFLVDHPGELLKFIV
jgi:phosphoglycolate phosphatase